MKRVLQHLVTSSVAAVVAAAVLAQDPAPAPIVPTPPITPLPAGSGVEPLPPDAEPPAPEPAPKPAKGKPAPPPPVIRPPGEEGKASTPLPPKAIEVPAAVQKEGDRPSRFYLQTGAGVQLMPNLKLKGFIPTDFSTISEVGFTSGTIETDIGAAWSILVGLRLSERASIEIESGYAVQWIDGFSGTVQEVLSGPILVGGTFSGGGDGQISMIPIFANISYLLPILERRAGRDEAGLAVRLAGGFGVTQLDASIDGITITSTAPVGGQGYALDGTSWQIAGQFRADVMWSVAANLDLGVGYRLMYMGSPDFGSGSFSDPVNFESAGGLSFDDLWVQSIQGTLTFRF
jgi:hypothetical protein